MLVFVCECVLVCVCAFTVHLLRGGVNGCGLNELNLIPPQI
jgi:hypothetical protein